MRTRLTAQQPPDHSFSKAKVQRSSLKSRPFPTFEESNEADAAQANLKLQAQANPVWHQPFIPIPMFDPTGMVRPRVQFKLTVGAPNDVYEQEADRVADQVMSMPDSATQQPVQREAMPEEDELQTKTIAASITPLVQRDAMPEEEEVQTKCEACGQEEQVQHLSGSAVQAQPDLEKRLSSSKGGGSPLPNDVLSFMESRFGADFSQVRVHTGSEAVQMNQDLNAQAFTHKQDVYFSAGKAPAKDALTAHELTHVVQQTRPNSAADRTRLVPVDSNKADIQKKCSSCEKEEMNLRRFTEVPVTSELAIQRDDIPTADESEQKRQCNEQHLGE